MGWRTVVDVRDNSRATGSAYTVAIMLAERAPDDTRLAWPGIEKLAQDARVNLRTAQRALKQLEALGEIVRRKEGHRGQAAEFFIAVGLKGDNQSSKERVTPAATKGDTPDVKGDIDDIRLYKEPNRTEDEPKEVRPEVVRLCELMAALVNERTQRKKPYAVTDEWRTEMRRLIDIDGRTPTQIEAAMRWVHEDEFWSANILSVPKLRAKYDTISLQARKGRRRGGSADRVRELLARGRAAA